MEILTSKHSKCNAISQTESGLWKNLHSEKSQICFNWYNRMTAEKFLLTRHTWSCWVTSKRALGNWHWREFWEWSYREHFMFNTLSKVITINYFQVAIACNKLHLINLDLNSTAASLSASCQVVSKRWYISQGNANLDFRVLTSLERCYFPNQL